MIKYYFHPDGEGHVAHYLRLDDEGLMEYLIIGDGRGFVKVSKHQKRPFDMKRSWKGFYKRVTQSDIFLMNL